MHVTRRRLVALASGSLVSGALAGALATPARSASDEAVPNVFISPHGRPYRAPAGAPYPVVDWFKAADRNGDGKLDRDEFVADAAAFFDCLDLRGGGVLGAGEISFYEHRIAPEVLGMRVRVYADGRARISPPEPRLWLAQFGESHGGPGRGPTTDPNEGSIVPPDEHPEVRQQHEVETSLTTGASPYGFFPVPEPVTAADADYVVTAVVRKTRFLARARDNFAALDPQSTGYLTLASLPQSPVQRLLGRGRTGRR